MNTQFERILCLLRNTRACHEYSVLLNNLITPTMDSWVGYIFTSTEKKRDYVLTFFKPK